MIRRVAIVLAMLAPFGVVATLASGHAGAVGPRCRIEVYDDGAASPVCLNKQLDPRPIWEWSAVRVHLSPPYVVYCVALDQPAPGNCVLGASPPP